MRIRALVNSMRGDERPFLRGLEMAGIAVRRFGERMRSADFLPYRPDEANATPKELGCLHSAFLAVLAVLTIGLATGMLVLVWLSVYLVGQKAGVW